MCCKKSVFVYCQLRGSAVSSLFPSVGMAVGYSDPRSASWAGVDGCGSEYWYGGCEIGLRRADVGGGCRKGLRVGGFGCGSGSDHDFFEVDCFRGVGGCRRGSHLVGDDCVADVSRSLVGCESGGGSALFDAAVETFDFHAGSSEPSDWSRLRRIC